LQKRPHVSRAERSVKSHLEHVASIEGRDNSLHIDNVVAGPRTYLLMTGAETSAPARFSQP